MSAINSQHNGVKFQTNIESKQENSPIQNNQYALQKSYSRENNNLKSFYQAEKQETQFYDLKHLRKLNRTGKSVELPSLKSASIEQKKLIQHKKQIVQNGSRNQKIQHNFYQNLQNQTFSSQFIQQEIKKKNKMLFFTENPTKLFLEQLQKKEQRKENKIHESKKRLNKYIEDKAIQNRIQRLQQEKQDEETEDQREKEKLLEKEKQKQIKQRLEQRSISHQENQFKKGQYKREYYEKKRIDFIAYIKGLSCDVNSKDTKNNDLEKQIEQIKNYNQNLNNVHSLGQVTKVSEIRELPPHLMASKQFSDQQQSIMSPVKISKQLKYQIYGGDSQISPEQIQKEEEQQQVNSKKKQHLVDTYQKNCRQSFEKFKNILKIQHSQSMKFVPQKLQNEKQQKQIQQHKPHQIKNYTIIRQNPSSMKNENQPSCFEQKGQESLQIQQQQQIGQHTKIKQYEPEEEQDYSEYENEYEQEEEQEQEGENSEEKQYELEKQQEIHKSEKQSQQSDYEYKDEEYEYDFS